VLRISTGQLRFDRIEDYFPLCSCLGGALGFCAFGAFWLGLGALCLGALAFGAGRGVFCACCSPAGRAGAVCAGALALGSLAGAFASAWRAGALAFGSLAGRAFAACAGALARGALAGAFASRAGALAFGWLAGRAFASRAGALAFGSLAGRAFVSRAGVLAFASPAGRALALAGLFSRDRTEGALVLAPFAVERFLAGVVFAGTEARASLGEIAGA
jgi:hypothetical protein